MRDLGGAYGAEKSVERLRQALRLKLIKEAVGVAADVDQIGGLQQREVAGDGRAGDIEASGDLAGWKRAVLELFQDLAADGVGERSENTGGGLHNCNIAILLNSVKVQHRSLTVAAQK